jgi:hypothetical protein
MENEEEEEEEVRKGVEKKKSVDNLCLLAGSRR